MSQDRAKKITTYQSGFRVVNGLFNSFIVYNPKSKKNERFAINPPAVDLKSATAFKHQVEIQLGIAQSKAKKRFEFLQKYKDQEKLFESYTKHRQKVAKRTWKGDVSIMKSYVLPYFMGQLNLNHPSLWFDHWQDFQDSLGKPLRNNTKTRELAVNSKENIVKTANSFIAYVELHENGGVIKRLPSFKYEDKGRRGVECLYPDSEINSVITEFRKLGHDVYADLFFIISKTGMRVSEAIGLMAIDIVIGKIPSQEKWIFNSLKDKTDIFGYILLKSQAYDANKLVINGEAKRAPLKSRSRIAAEYNRIIPLMEQDTAEILQKLKIASDKSGLVFFGHSYREFYKIFVGIKAKLKLPKERDIHSLRHTFATRFTGLCDGDPRVAEKVLGHSNSKMTQRYNHLANELESLDQQGHVPTTVKAIKFS